MGTRAEDGGGERSTGGTERRVALKCSKASATASRFSVLVLTMAASALERCLHMHPDALPCS